MKGVSPISFDFNRMKVSFETEGRKMTLSEGKEVGMCKMISGKRLQRVIKRKWGRWPHLFLIVAVEEVQAGPALQGEIYLTVSAPQGRPDQVHHSDLLNKLLIEYEDLFLKPQSLPPTRVHNHSINLKPHTEGRIEDWN